MSSARLRLRPRWPVCLCYAALLLLCWTAAAAAIDRYEIQIYSGETAPLHHLTLELHSNSVVTAHGALAKEQLRPDEFHETFEVTYGLTPHLELGQSRAYSVEGRTPEHRPREARSLRGHSGL